MLNIRALLALLLCPLLFGCAPIGQPLYRSQFGPIKEQMSRQKPDKPNLKRLKNGHFRVTKPWTINLNGRKWLIPAGYKTNGITAPASIKRSLGDGVDYPETWAAIFHDWLFTQPGISRSEADHAFHSLLLAYGVSPLKAEVLFAAVSAYSMCKSEH